MLNNTLFEISYETANKIGGIHTVISSKANYIKEEVASYYLIGPELGQKENIFSEEELPPYFELAKQRLEKEGIKIRFGTWKIDAKPKIFLVEHSNLSNNINELKKDLWEKWNVDTMNSSWHDFDSVFLWSYSVGKVIEELMKDYDEEVLVQAHEWMSGGAIFYLKTREENKKFKTIFTTHATMLGRSLCGNGVDLYKVLENLDPEKEAYRIGVQSKHQFEKALANNSEVFTTVSDITNKEAQKFYNKKADILLYNGFENLGIEKTEDIKKFREESKEQIKKFTKSYFNNFYDIDIKNTLFLYTSGRNEFRNKGVDIYIKSLGILDRKLRSENSKKTIVNFFLILIGEFEKNKEVLNSIENYNKGIHREEEIENAPLSTHYLPWENEIMKGLIEEDLKNHKDNRIKNIIIPVYLGEDDSIFNLEYYHLISGMDLGIFPSFYEPWGYTPLESISYAVPTITSDQSGFGMSIKTSCGDACMPVATIQRLEENDDTSINELTNFLGKFTRMGEEQREFQREIAKFLAMKYDWSIFIHRYEKAFKLALERNK